MAAGGPASSGQCPQNPFSSLDTREERKTDEIQSGLEKVFHFNGVNELYTKMKGFYGRTPAWSALMKCNAIYLKDWKTAIGVDNGRYGLFFADDVTKPTWSPDIGANLMNLGEKACLDAQEAKTQRLQCSLKRCGALVQQVLEKSKQAKEQMQKAEELQKKIDQINESNKVLHRKMQERNVEYSQKVITRIHELQKDRDLWMSRAAHYEQENVRLRIQLGTYDPNRSKLMTFLAWMCVAIIAFSSIQLADASEIKDNRTEDCFPTSGCVLSDVPWTKSYTFMELMDKCVTGTAIIPKNTFNGEGLELECIKNFGKKWCKGRVEKLIPHYCDRDNTFDALYQYYVETVAIAVDFFKVAVQYRIDNWIVALFSLVLTGKMEKFLKTLPFVILAWWFKLPIFVMSIATTIFPVHALPFLFFQVCFPNFVIITGFLLWMTSILVAFYWFDGTAILVEVSYAVFYTIIFFVWSIALTIISTLSLTVPVQILLFCVSLTIYCGTKFACSTITVTNPDGTVSKYSRVAKMKDTVAIQCKKMVSFGQARGVIPATPVKVNSIVVVEGKKGSGVGFRFMNYIITAGHVTSGSDWVTVKHAGTVAKTKVLKQIEVFECDDTIAVIKLPPELQNLKPIKLAKRVESTYLTLTAFDPNFQNVVSYTGWCIIDGNWISNAFNTQFGNSGGPYVDAEGKLVGIHLGTQGVMSQGIVVVDALKTHFTLADQCKDFDYDGFLEKVIAGTKTSHEAILKGIEELREDVDTLKNKCKNYDEYWLVQTIFGQKKKGKTKKTARGNKHLVTKRFLSKGHFMKLKMLTDEEYNHMIEQGFTADEIREAVNELREQAWLNYCIDNDIDEEGAEEWYEDMIEDDQINEKIDEAIEKAMEERGEFYQVKKRKTFAQQALLHLIRVSKARSQTAKQEVQKENADQLYEMFKSAVKDEQVDEGTTSYALFANGDQIEMVEGKELDFEKVKLIHVDGEQKNETIPGTKVTEISTGPENKKNILRKKDTQINPEQAQPLEQRKRICKWCGSSQKHDFRDCKFQREKRFCVFCAKMHSLFDGHQRDVLCDVCGKKFKSVEELEQHVTRETCEKN
nr:non-structural polyprotein [Goose astrovirus]